MAQITDYGYEGFERNEQTIGSRVDDPPKLRLTSPLTEHGGGGGVISFNKHNAGSIAMGGQQTEMGMVRVEQSDTVRGDAGNPKAEINFMLNDGSGGGDDAMKKPLSFTWNTVTHIEPALAQSLAAVLSPYMGGGSGSRIVSPNGRYWFQPAQDDGNLVLYDAIDPEHPKAVFDLFWLMEALHQLKKNYPQ